MKKLLFGAAALAMLATASCKKDDDKGPSNYIKLAGDTYNVSAFQTSGSIISVSGASGSNAAGLTFHFGTGTSAPSAGTYKVVASAKSATEVDITAARTVNGTAAAYSSTGAGTVNVTLAINGDKTTITLPDAPAKQSIGGSEEINVSANATQP